MISSSDTFTYPLICLQETDSTNRYLSHICNEQPETIAEFTTVTA